jgi:hypothetical protein
MAKDHYFDVAAQMTGGTSDKLEQTAQQKVREREEHGPNLPREGGPILRARCPWRRSAVCVPFTVASPIEWRARSKRVCPLLHDLEVDIEVRGARAHRRDGQHVR